MEIDKRNRDWPLLTFEGDEGMANGVTVPVKMVVLVRDKLAGGCELVMREGHTVTLLQWEREAITDLMVEALR